MRLTHQFLDARFTRQGAILLAVVAALVLSYTVSPTRVEAGSASFNLNCVSNCSTDPDVLATISTNKNTYSPGEVGSLTIKYESDAPAGSSFTGNATWTGGGSWSGSVSRLQITTGATISIGSFTVPSTGSSYTLTVNGSLSPNYNGAASQNIVVSISQPNQTLTTSVSGGGTITSSPAGINCGATCSASYAYGTNVSLTATPSSGNTFTGWSGACSGTGGCTVSMTQARNVTASFGAACTVTHDTSWSACTASCGGGWQYEYYHTSPGSTCGAISNGQVYAQQQCNTQACPVGPSATMWVSPSPIAYGGSTVYGWSTSNATYCRFYVDGNLAGDTNNGWPINNASGWADAPLYTDRTYRIECTNATGQWTSSQATVDITPLIVLDSVTSGQVGSCGFVSGWAFDPSRPSQSINVHQYYYNPFTGYDTGPTAVNRADVNSTYGITGVHGFQYQIPIAAAGTYTARSYAIGINGSGVQNGNNPFATEKTFTCDPAPVNNASCVSVTGVPASIYAGQTFTPTVTTYNNGTKQWNRDGTPHSIGFATPYDSLLFGLNRVSINPTTVNPGQYSTMTFTATAPTSAGTYQF
ncbi:MAG TPA: hypothetical protein VFS75_00445, partial [Candidatus Paceibacterota bacterium]|nr:hypothetical protein [Candidatus Paceibacterota bacterium]